MAVSLTSVATHVKYDKTGRFNQPSPCRRKINHVRHDSRETTCPSLSLYQPKSQDSILVSELISSLESGNLKTSWISLVPQRIGHSQSIDLASKAAIKAMGYRASGTTSYNSCLRSYVAAVSQLRNRLGTENLRDLNDNLLTAALLFYAEVCMDPKTSSLSAHPRGISTILIKALKTKRVQQHGDFSTNCVVASHILYFNWKSTFEAPVAQGRASPFEDPHWLEMEPLFYGNLPKDVKALRKLSHQLFIRLPLLIAMVRDIRNRTGDYDINAGRAVALELSNSLQDKDAENTLLHRINVRKTVDHADTDLIPFHFHFDDMNVFEAAMYYWQARIMLYRLCIKLQDLHPRPDVDIDRSTLISENNRMAINMMMAWPFAYAAGMMGNWATCVGYLALWGTTADVSEFHIGNAKVPLQTVRAWILNKYNILYRGTTVFCEDDLDGSADLLVGGALKVFTVPVRFRKQYMELYQQKTNLNPTDWITSFK